MIAFASVFIRKTTIMDRDLMNLVLEKGHSRVPVYYEQTTNIIGLVLVTIFLWLQCSLSSAICTYFQLVISLSKMFPLTIWHEILELDDAL